MVGDSPCTTTNYIFLLLLVSILTKRPSLLHELYFFTVTTDCGNYIKFSSIRITWETTSKSRGAEP